MIYRMNIPTDTIFGVGSLNLLHAQKLPGKKSMIVISNGKSTKSNGYLDRVENELKQINIDFIVFDKIQANPLKATVEEGAALARNNNCDFIIALGGGSVMDAAKVIAMLTNETGDLWDYVPFGKGKGLPRKNKALPIVCITTTAGTGSEVDQYGVITNPDTHEKIGIGFNDMFPVIAIVDPELMLTVPPKFTAYQGFDALFHSTEGYISKFANPVSEMFSLNAIKNISSNLPTCVNDGKNINAREKVAFGNTLSGYEMVTGSTSSKHSMEHAMSAYHQELPHGAGLIMISKAYYTHFINAHACDDRFIKMAKVMGIKNASDPNDFITALMKLQNDCGVADLKMSDYNIETDEFDTLATNAKESMGALFECDRIKLSHDDVVNIYKNSYK